MLTYLFPQISCDSKHEKNRNQTNTDVTGASVLLEFKVELWMWEVPRLWGDADNWEGTEPNPRPAWGTSACAVRFPPRGSGDGLSQPLGCLGDRRGLLAFLAQETDSTVFSGVQVEAELKAGIVDDHSQPQVTVQHTRLHCTVTVG